VLRSLLRRERPGLPDDWRNILDARSRQWALLDEPARVRLGELAEHLLTTKHWEAARGLTMTDDVRTVIAAHAGLLVLGLDEHWYDEVGTIVVRRGAMRRGAPTARWGVVDGVVDGSDDPIDGEAHDGRGPVMINWTSARREAASIRFGRDVVLHEFAHKLDMLDGLIDGTPPIDDELDRQRWIDVCTAEYEALAERAEDRLLRDYAATNPGEFFAVATEVFFTRGMAMAERRPDLYAVLAAFYRQDPAARTRPS